MDGPPRAHHTTPSASAGGAEDGGARTWFERHAVFLLVALAGAAARIIVSDVLDPVMAGQHALGMVTGAVVYALLLRWGVARWLAGLATAPVLWDGYRLASEHVIAADTLFALLVVAAVLVLFWRAQPGLVAALVAAVLLGAGAVVHLVTAPPLATGSGAEHPVLGHLPGPTLGLVLAGGLVLGLAAATGAGRARASGMRVVALVTSLLPVAVVLGDTLFLEGTMWGYQLPAQALLPAAGALGLTALLRGRRGEGASRPQADDVDRAAQQEFRERYDDPALAPVVVIIAAYNEAAGLPRVLSTMPSTVCGLPVDVVVVDDGSVDGTAEAVRTHAHAYTVSAPVNRGQGAAMRLGYRVAREHGARFILTTDADGQYDTADFPAVLSPILNDEADFVTGSRRLGHHHSDDRFRRTGVFVFAWAVTVLTGQRVTDTSFGLRAMRAEVTAAVTLNQAQYQSAELLIGVYSHGFRILEVPGTMRLRSAGSTKKGGNISYGLRYACVVLGTWWREGCPRPAKDKTPALQTDADLTRAPHTR